jgi:hypothetical protein
VSQGRSLFGVGGDWNQDEMENHGTIYASWFKRMRESKALRSGRFQVFPASGGYSQCLSI